MDLINGGGLWNLMNWDIVDVARGNGVVDSGFGVAGGLLVMWLIRGRGLCDLVRWDTGGVAGGGSSALGRAWCRLTLLQVGDGDWMVMAWAGRSRRGCVLMLVVAGGGVKMGTSTVEGQML